MTLRRRRNGWARNQGRSLGSVFGAWSAASVRARWFYNTVPHLCAKFGALRTTFNEISTWSSITLMQVDPCLKMDVYRKTWLNWVWDGFIRLSKKMIQWFCCFDSTHIVELSACKTKGHIRTFQRYFDSLTQKASRLLFIRTIIVYPWILCDAGFNDDWAAFRVENILAPNPLCGKSWSSVCMRLRSKRLFRALISPAEMKKEV